MLVIPDNLLKPQNRNSIIAIEGVDGSGKTTLCEYLESNHEEFCFVRIPEAYTQKPFKDYLAFKTTHISSALIYCGSLADRKTRIGFFEDGIKAVTDRSIWSTLTLLYARHPEDVQSVIAMFSAISEHLPIPDVVYVLDIPFSVCQERIMARKKEIRKYDNMMHEEYTKHMEFYHLLKECGVNIKFIPADGMTYEDEMSYIVGDLNDVQE